MINVLIVDDSNDKIAKVVSTIRSLSETIHVDFVIDSISAQKYLSEKKYDLLILDISLPLREGEKPGPEVGKNLLSEINRKKNFNSPNYILGLTQHDDADHILSSVWPTIKYSPETDEWKISISDLIKHILKSNNLTVNRNEVLPTIFVEGKNDEKLILEAITLFKPEILSKISIRSESSIGGASWVARQIIVWAHSLNKDSNGGYMKAIGLLDGDQAGIDSREEINRKIRSDSAEAKTFHLFRLSPTYARHIIPIVKKGLNIPICAEEMFEMPHWKYAQDNKWLDLRNKPENFLSEPKNWNGFETTLKEHLTTLGLTEDEKLYLNCFNEKGKEDFVKYILGFDTEKKKEAMKCFEKLIDEMSNYLLGTELKTAN